MPKTDISSFWNVRMCFFLWSHSKFNTLGLDIFIGQNNISMLSQAFLTVRNHWLQLWTFSVSFLFVCLDLISMLKMHRSTRCECDVGKVWKRSQIMIFFISWHKKEQKLWTFYSVSLNFNKGPHSWFYMLHIPTDHFKFVSFHDVNLQWHNPTQSVFYFTLSQRYFHLF